MINHSDCDHPRTSSARARCRRQKAGGDSKPTRQRAAPQTEKDEESSYGQVPRDRHMQCDVCGVERIAYKGLDVLTGVTLYVGEKCYYMVKRDPDGAIPLD